MAALLALMTCQAFASPIIKNGDFASGNFPPDWIKKGNAEVQTSAGLFGSPKPPATHHAILGTGTIGNELLGGNAVPASELESFTKLSGGTLLEKTRINCPTCLVGNGSAIQTTFNAAAGSQLSFDWNFITSTEPKNAPQDIAFWVLDKNYYFLANTHSALVKSTDTNFSYETGYQSISFSILTSDPHTLSFGIVDGATGGGSALALTNVQLNAVPLPAACWLFLMGIVGLFKYSRQFKHA